jgi:hypothetical protein
MNTMNPVASSLSADEVLAHVQRLYARLQLLPVGTKQHSVAYTALEDEIRVWADRYRAGFGIETGR